jgi:hypothetical protein
MTDDRLRKIIASLSELERDAYCCTLMDIEEHTPLMAKWCDYDELMGMLTAINLSLEEAPNDKWLISATRQVEDCLRPFKRSKVH